MTLMKKLEAAGYPREEMYHYESDLYVFLTPLTLHEACSSAHSEIRLPAGQCMTLLSSTRQRLIKEFDIQGCQNEYVIKELSDMVREPDFDKAMEHFQNVSDMNAYFEKLLAIVNPSVYEEISKENGSID